MFEQHTFGKYRIVESEGDVLVLELFWQDGSYRSEPAQIKIVVDRHAHARHAQGAAYRAVPAHDAVTGARRSRMGDRKGRPYIMIDVGAYLRRIGYDGPTVPAIDTLRALHGAHLLAVPFENLDIHLGRPIVLDEARLFAKIVGERRGGFCYELNGLFAALLRALGFRVTLHSARVYDGDGRYGQEFDHLVLVVSLEERWLADVGFGDSFRLPLRLDERGDQVQDGHAYRIADQGDHLTMLEHGEDGAVLDGYAFTLQPRRLEEFAGMCHYHQTSPESSFTQKRICSRATPEGRVSLSDNRLIITERGERREVALGSQEEYAATLREHFGIELDGA